MKPRKTEKRKSSLRISPTNLKNKKEKLLARWTDGLFYFVKVNRVSEANKTCGVEFEDQSTAQVQFKDLLEAHDDGDDECHFCGDAEPAPSNIMVTCSNCERVYHQHCHVPQVEDEELKQKFVCRICVFASCAQTGGAKTTGHLAEKFAVMKKSLPYEPKNLTWDASRTSNAEQLFCYCGGPGCWYNKMLQCCRCKQWFHEACLQCLREQLLVGDHFYVFACAHCNHGKEFLLRMDMKWLDIVYVSLFHLTMTMSTRYVDVEDVVSCVMNHSSCFKLKEVLNGHHGSWQAVEEQVLQTLRKNNQIFICAAELRKKNTLYGIRDRIPRAPHSYYIPGPGEKITKESLQQAPSSNKRFNFSPSKCHSPVVYVANGIKKAQIAKPRRQGSKMGKLAHVKTEHNYCTPLKCPDRHHNNCRSDSPSSTSTISDAMDLVIFDTNNNSPSKPQTPLDCGPVSPPLSLDQRMQEVNNSEIHEKKEEEKVDCPKSGGVTGRRGRSRSLSQTRDLKCHKNGAAKSNGKCFPQQKTKQQPQPDTSLDNSDEEKFELDKDEEPLSPSLSETSNGETKTEKPFWSLDTAVPPPSNFTGANNPFLTEYEQESLRQRRQHFEQELNSLASMLQAKTENLNGNYSNGSTLSTASGICFFPPPGVSEVSGFRGELKSVIKAKPGTPPAPANTLSAALSNNGTSKGPEVKNIGSPTNAIGNLFRPTTSSPEKTTPKSRRSLYIMSASDNNSSDSNTNSKANTSATVLLGKSSPPAPLCVNGVRISPMALGKLTPKNGLVTPSGNGSSCSMKTSPNHLINSGGRSGRRQQRALDGSKDKSLSSLSSPTSSRRVKEEDKAAQKRLAALQKCLKSLSPTCGFHFPVLDESHPAVTSSLDLSPIAKSGDDSGEEGNSSGNKVNGGSHCLSSPSHKAGTMCSGSPSTSRSSPLQTKSVNENSWAEGSGKRGKKRKFSAQDMVDSKALDRKGKGVLTDQENVRRSHRSRNVVNKFQAALDGQRFRMSNSNNLQAACSNMADQYDVISLRVGYSGRVEYLIDWGQ